MSVPVWVLGMILSLSGSARVVEVVTSGQSSAWPNLW